MFDPPKPATEKQAEAKQAAPLLDAADSAVVPVAISSSEAKDAWRKLPIDTLAIPKGLEGKLRDSGIGSLGDFSAHQEKHGEFWAKEIGGVGPAAAGKISDAWEAFWAMNPQYSE